MVDLAPFPGSYHRAELWDRSSPEVFGRRKLGRVGPVQELEVGEDDVLVVGAD